MVVTKMCWLSPVVVVVVFLVLGSEPAGRGVATLGDERCGAGGGRGVEGEKDKNYLGNRNADIRLLANHGRQAPAYQHPKKKNVIKTKYIGWL